MNEPTTTRWPPARLAALALLAAPFLFLAYVWWSWHSFSEKKDAERAAEESSEAAERAKPSAPEDLSACRLCESAETGPGYWMFNGQYSNAQCTIPIAHASFDACSVVRIPELHERVEVHFNTPLGSKKMGDKAPVDFGLQLVPNEGMVFKKEGGKCVSAGHLGLKWTPIGCDDSRVCRKNGQLTCDDCTVAANHRCPSFEGSSAVASFFMQ